MRIATDICIIGAGSGGLSVAAGAARMGAGTVLIERDRMGGDCLNSGCVPSKALLAAARAAQAVRTGIRFGIGAGNGAGHEPVIDYGRVHDHVHGTIRAIAPHDSVERFTGLGVRVIPAAARFTGPDTVLAGDDTITARRFVIATGSRPAMPPIPGLDQIPVLTSESLFESRRCPDRLIVIGGGPIGVEMAQAYRRLGAMVTLLEQATILARDDPELVAVVRRALTADGVDLREGAAIRRIERHGRDIAVTLADGSWLEGSDLLVATGRRPNVEDLGLETAGVACSATGIATDARLRTSNRRIFAIGDVTGGPHFTHVAGYHAGIVLRNILFRLPARVDYAALPWVTYTEPELARIGLTEAMARDRHGAAVRVLRSPFAENDRARAEGTTEGLVKVIATPAGRVLGASIVGPHAGELLPVWALAIAKGLKIGAVAGLIAPYPTLWEANKRAAAGFFTPRLFSARTRGIVRFLLRFA